MKRFDHSGEFPLHEFSPEVVEAAAKAWWEALRNATGFGVTWDAASDEAKEATREYIRGAA